MQLRSLGGAHTMKNKLISAITFAIALLGSGIASASSFILDTGTPPTTTPVDVLNAVDWYAAEFSVTAGETITQLSAYLTQGAGEVGDTFTWDIYSASGTFLGRNREAPSFTTTGTFSGNGWNSVSVNLTLTPGLYWVALQVSGPSQTRGLDLPTESSVSSGTVPAIAFAFAGTNGQFELDTTSPFGIEISAVPLPATVWLLASGLLGLGSVVRRRRN
jgi:hypothetical protein